LFFAGVVTKALEILKNLVRRIGGGGLSKVQNRGLLGWFEAIVDVIEGLAASEAVGV
jgi:hypothetical protein